MKSFINIVADYHPFGPLEFGGGGGHAGEIKLPAYIETYHDALLGASPAVFLTAEVDTAVTNNPLATFSLTDPAADFTASQTRYDSYDTIVSGLAEETDWAAKVDAAIAKADTAGVLNDLGIESIRTAARSSAEEGIQKAVVEAVMGASMAEQMDWKEFYDLAKQEIQNTLTIDIDAIITAAENDADSIIQAAVSRALSSSQDALITTAVDNFRTRRETDRASSLRSFLSSMAGVNAVHGSSFIMGIALIENEHQRAVADYDSELSRAMYDNAFQGFIQAISGPLRERAGRALEGDVAEQQLITNAVGAMASAFNARYSLQESITRTYAGLIQSEIEAGLRAGALEKESRDRFVLTGTKDMAQLLMQKVDANRLSAQLQGELNRVKVAGRMDYELSDVDLDKESVMWPLTVLNAGMPVLSQPLAGAGYIPNKTSKTASSIGGAIQGAGVGASIGSAVPGIGTAVGAGVGAFVGLLGGLSQ